MSKQIELTANASASAAEGRSPDASALHLSGVSVRFGGVLSLDDVSFTVQPNEIVAVVGPNGAGKSTLLNAVSGLLGSRPSGSINLFGVLISGRRPDFVARQGLGRSFQDPPLIDTESVLQNVLGGAHTILNYGMLSQVFRARSVRSQELEAQELALDLLSLCGLADQAHAIAGALPYGSRKLVDIVRALVARPGLLLLDEPTSGLDAGEQATVVSLLEKVRGREALAMLVVEHHMQLVREIADRVVGLQAGSVLAVGTPSEVLDSAAFRTAVIGGHVNDKSIPGGAGIVTPPGTESDVPRP